MSTRDWTAITRLRFFAMLQEARSLKKYGMDANGRLVFLHGYSSGFDYGNLRGFEQGIFHFLPEKNVKEAVECSRKLDAKNTVRGELADAAPIVAGSVTPNSKPTD